MTPEERAAEANGPCDCAVFRVAWCPTCRIAAALRAAERAAEARAFREAAKVAKAEAQAAWPGARNDFYYDGKLRAASDIAARLEDEAAKRDEGTR